MLINNKKNQVKAVWCTVLQNHSTVLPLWLTTADRAACVPVFIHLRKYHLKPHLSCISCSLTFHFVWQTLIFTSKVLSRRHPTHTYLLCWFSRGCFRRNRRNTHTNKWKLREITFEGSLKYCQICWIRTVLGLKCVGDTVGWVYQSSIFQSLFLSHI